MAAGRFAPSPTGPLHVGNLRTAVIAWLVARSSDSTFSLRVEDLDRIASRSEIEARQVDDLVALGLDWDGPVVRQSERAEAHLNAINTLRSEGRLYRCWCTRAEVAAATQAPHGPLPEGAYPGTCARMPAREVAARERSGRPFAWRLRAEGASVAAADRLHGQVERVVDDFVIVRNDGAPAYNLAVVVDDAAAGIEEVVRGDDLLDTTPRQMWLCSLLGLPVPAYVHLPLVVGPDGQRLAKRHGAVTLSQVTALDDWSVSDVLGWVATTLGGPPEPVGSAASMLPWFTFDHLIRSRDHAVHWPPEAC